jgi:catechol 2,3-dioxygenase-like lactoylglutathione lyase family enzyme
MKINHIGYVVRSLNKSCKFYCDHFDYSVKVERIYVKNQSVEIIMLKSSIETDPDLELIKPVGEDSPASNALKRGIVLNHIAYQTPFYNKILEKFKNKLVRPSMPAPFELFGGGRTFFVYLNGVLTEFVEEVNNN